MSLRILSRSSEKRKVKRKRERGKRRLKMRNIQKVRLFQKGGTTAKDINAQKGDIIRRREKKYLKK